MFADSSAGVWVIYLLMAWGLVMVIRAVMKGAKESLKNEDTQKKVVDTAVGFIGKMLK